MYKKVYEI